MRVRGEVNFCPIRAPRKETAGALVARAPALSSKRRAERRPRHVPPSPARALAIASCSTSSRKGKRRLVEQDRAQPVERQLQERLVVRRELGVRLGVDGVALAGTTCRKRTCGMRRGPSSPSGTSFSCARPVPCRTARRASSTRRASSGCESSRGFARHRARRPARRGIRRPSARAAPRGPCSAAP